MISCYHYDDRLMTFLSFLRTISGTIFLYFREKYLKSSAKLNANIFKYWLMTQWLMLEFLMARHEFTSHDHKLVITHLVIDINIIKSLKSQNTLDLFYLFYDTIIYFQYFNYLVYIYITEIRRVISLKLGTYLLCTLNSFR